MKHDDKDIGKRFGPWPFPDFRAMARKSEEAKRKKAARRNNERNRKDARDGK